MYLSFILLCCLWVQMNILLRIFIFSSFNLYEFHRVLYVYSLFEFVAKFTLFMKRGTARGLMLPFLLLLLYCLMKGRYLQISQITLPLKFIHLFVFEAERRGIILTIFSGANDIS